MTNPFLHGLAQIQVDPSDIDSVPQVGDPQTGVSAIMGWVFILVVAIATIVMIIAGINYITSRGDPQKTANAKSTIIYAMVGIVVAALATSLVRFIAESVS